MKYELYSLYTFVLVQGQVNSNFQLVLNEMGPGRTSWAWYFLRPNLNEIVLLMRPKQIFKLTDKKIFTMRIKKIVYLDLCNNYIFFRLTMDWRLTVAAAIGLPVSFLYLIDFLLSLHRRVDVRGKVVLITGASSGLGRGK